MAMRADEQDLWMEGKFWLALVEGEAFPAPADMAVATDVFEEGYLIVPIRWYELVDTERRGYKLHTEVRHVVVNAMVFLDGLQFEGGTGGGGSGGSGGHDGQRGQSLYGCRAGLHHGPWRSCA